jgi:hypothetical protein
MGAGAVAVAGAAVPVEAVSVFFEHAPSAKSDTAQIPMAFFILNPPGGCPVFQYAAWVRCSVKLDANPREENLLCQIRPLS